MTISYSWDWSSQCLTYQSKVGNYSDVVTQVKYTLCATDGVYTARHTASVVLGPPSDPFVAMKDLTPEMVAGWIEEKVGTTVISQLQVKLANMIAVQANPPLTANPPWMN